MEMQAGQIQSPVYDYSHWARFGIVGEIRHIRIADVIRDIELIKQILIEIRDRPDLKLRPVIIKEYEPVFLARHVEQLYYDGLVEGRLVETLGQEAPLVLVKDLSSAGHDFLGSLENKDVWNRLKEALSPEELARLPLAELKNIAVDLAGHWVRKRLGLDK